MSVLEGRNAAVFPVAFRHFYPVVIASTIEIFAVDRIKCDEKLMLLQCLLVGFWEAPK